MSELDQAHVSDQNQIPDQAHISDQNQIPDVLRPAPVEPVDTDGRLAFALGTVGFAIGALVAWLLDHRDNAYICLMGVGIGLIGSLYTWRRNHRPPHN